MNDLVDAVYVPSKRVHCWNSVMVEVVVVQSQRMSTASIDNLPNARRPLMQHEVSLVPEKNDRRVCCQTIPPRLPSRRLPIRASQPLEGTPGKDYGSVKERLMLIAVFNSALARHLDKQTSTRD